jgi:hypothetical protein
MTPEPMHDEMREALAALALGALDGQERAHLLAHLAGCEACRAELAELRGTAGLLAAAAPSAPMDAARSGRVRARLLARAAADRDGADRDVSDRTLVARDGEERTLIAPAPPPAPVRAGVDDDVTRVIPITAAPRRRSTVLPWLAAAASLVLLIGTAVYAMGLRGKVLTQAAWMSAAEEEQNRLQRALGEREATLAAVSAPSVRVIDMASAGAPEPGGRMFWDKRTDRWTFFAHNLPAVQDGREYQLWLITPGGRKLPAPTFRPGPRGEARVEATYALAADSLAAVAVTLEPTGGLPEPSGPVVIVGAMSSR